MQRPGTYSHWVILTVVALANLISSSPAPVTSGPSESRNNTARPTGSHVLPDPNSVVNSPQSTATSSADLLPGDIGLDQSCSSVDGGIYDTRCWGILNVGVYLTDPVVGWNRTVPVCGIRGSDSDRNNTEKCCEASEPWSTCYLRLATLNPGLDCTSLESPYCSIVPAHDLAPIIAPQVHYVIKNIVSK